MSRQFDSFDVISVLEAGSELRAVTRGTSSAEESARAVVDYLRSAFVNNVNDRPAFELVRFYKTIRCGDLPTPLQDAARAASSDSRSLHASPCLTLLATAGSRPSWNDRHQSSRHRAIPLESVEAVAQMPMVAGLLDSLGVDVTHLTEDAPMEFEASTGVFFVPHAIDSALIPAQAEFVLPFGIESVVGFGGRLPDGSAFAIVAFSSVPIEASSVPAFEAMGLSATLAMLPVLDGSDFIADARPRQRTPSSGSDAARLSVMSLLVDAIESALADHVPHHDDDRASARDEADVVTAERRKHHRLAARQEFLVEYALDCVVDMDSTGRITGFNSAAVSVFGHERDAVLGQQLADVIIPPEERERHRLGLDAYLATGEGRIIGRRIEVEALHADGSRFPIELTVVASDEEPPTFTGRMRNLSEQKTAERALLASRERLAHVARTLQQSLLPAQLPSIPGASLAAIYRPAGEGNDVGGDFYDVFSLGDGCWAMVLGDVCGKGPEAASLTALVRYTLRAALVAGNQPEAAVDLLNTLIANERPGDFCTLAAIFVDPSDRSAVVLTAGHPPVIHLTATGSIHRIDSSGYFVGPFPTWKGETRKVALDPGDRLLAYTDGLTEARRGDHEFGADAFDETLGQLVGDGIGSTVARLEEAVVSYCGALRDDLAILGCQIDIETIITP